VREALLCGEHERVTRALHYLGRQVDTLPATASASSTPGGHSGAPLLPTSIPAVPHTHAGDAGYLALVDRTTAAVLAVVEVAGGLRSPGLLSSSAASLVTTVASSPAAAAAAAGGAPALVTAGPEGSLDAGLLSTGLSVLRKLFRNAAAYLLPSAAGALGSLLSICQHVPREQLTVVERTFDEVAERLPVDVTLQFLVGATAACAAASPSAPDGAALGVAAYRALARLVPRIPAHLLLDECGRGRMMSAVRAAFGSPSSDVRRAVVQALVALSLALRGHFTRYVDAYLAEGQSKLLAIYVEKALATSGGAPGGVGGGSSSSGGGGSALGASFPAGAGGSAGGAAGALGSGYAAALGAGYGR
jgi:uncharacterized membrane protein YgcG